MSGQPYALIDAGDVFVYLDDTRSTHGAEPEVFAEWPDEDRSFLLKRAEARGWWMLEQLMDVPARVRVVRPPRKVRNRYVLNAQAKAAAGVFPSEMSIEHYDAKTDDESESYDPTIAALYEVEYVDGEPREEVFENFVRLEGAPPPVDGLTWSASLPYELRYKTEYLHLFPGRLVGFREALAARLEQLPQVSNVFNHGKFSVYVRLQVDPPVGRGHKAWSSTTEHIEWRIADEVAAANRADAVEEWNRLMAGRVREVEEATVVICGHCKGTGVKPNA